MQTFKYCVSVIAGVALSSTAALAQNNNNMTPPSVGSNGEITGYTPTQGNMVKKKIAASGAGSPCGDYLRKRGWKQGVNKAGQAGEFTLAIGIAPTEARTTSPAYVDSRYVAFREAWLNANAEMAKALETQISSNTLKTIRSGGIKAPQQSKADQAANLREKAARIKEEKASDGGGIKGVYRKGTRYLNAMLDKELKSLGHDPDAERKARNETNASRKRALLAEAAKAEAAAKKILGKKAFKEVIKASAAERMKGIYSAFTSENLPPDPKDKAQICVLLRYSKSSERMADMMASRDFSNAPQLAPDIPLIQQLPDPGTPQGVFQLVTTWGLSILFDENGQVNLVAYSQSGYRQGDSIGEEAALTRAKLQASNLIRMFINQTVAVQESTKTSQDVTTFKNAQQETKLSKETIGRYEQKSEARPINGLSPLLDWNGVHPVTNGGIRGAVVYWNASNAAGAIAAKTRQNKVVKDRLAPAGNIQGFPAPQKPMTLRKAQPAPRKGGLRGSTRSKDF